jgi:hypothetical protein
LSAKLVEPLGCSAVIAIHQMMEMMLRKTPAIQIPEIQIPAIMK